jgi:hypothetical protein
MSIREVNLSMQATYTAEQSVAECEANFKKGGMCCDLGGHFFSLLINIT